MQPHDFRAECDELRLKLQAANTRIAELEAESTNRGPSASGRAGDLEALKKKLDHPKPHS